MAEPRHATRKPLFTKRHHEALARAFGLSYAALYGMLGADLKRVGVDVALCAVVNTLADDNPRFDAALFCEATKKGN